MELVRLVRRALLGVPVIGLAAAALALPQAASAATPTPPFTQCPAVGYNNSCSLLVDVQPGGIAIADDPNATQAADPVPGTYDGSDDTLVGVVNDTSSPVSQITLSSATLPIFGFDGDGICVNPNPISGLPGLPASDCADVNSIDTTGYGGPNTYFTNISADFMTGQVDFITPLAPGASTYFSLEDALTSGSIINPTTTSTSLSGGGHSGGSITVSPGTSVTDSATLTGFNAASATGTVTYNVYSDSACTIPVPGGSGSAETITTPGTLPASAPVSLTAPGTYYWRASYSGDVVANGPSMSTCGSEVETVAKPTGRATLKICKVAGTGVKLGTPVTFTIGSKRVTVPAGPAPGGDCVIAQRKLPAGQPVTVTEMIPNGQLVTAIKAAPAKTVVSKNVSGGTVTDALGAGVNEVTFTDQRVSGTGYAEICASSASGATGQYGFSYDSSSVKVFSGACSPAFKVHAGALTIKEKPRPGSMLDACKAIPQALLLQCNTSTRTAVISVLPGTISKETIVKFENS